MRRLRWPPGKGGRGGRAGGKGRRGEGRGGKGRGLRGREGVKACAVKATRATKTRREKKKRQHNPRPWASDPRLRRPRPPSKSRAESPTVPHVCPAPSRPVALPLVVASRASPQPRCAGPTPRWPARTKPACETAGRPPLRRNNIKKQRMRWDAVERPVGSSSCNPPRALLLRPPHPSRALPWFGGPSHRFFNYAAACVLVRTDRSVRSVSPGALAATPPRILPACRPASDFNTAVPPSPCARSLARRLHPPLPARPTAFHPNPMVTMASNGSVSSRAVAIPASPAFRLFSCADTSVLARSLPAPVPQNYKENGRTYHGFHKGMYMFPCDEVCVRSSRCRYCRNHRHPPHPLPFHQLVEGDGKTREGKKRKEKKSCR